VVELEVIKEAAVMGLSLKYRPVIEAKSNNCCKEGSYATGKHLT
jgi:hypothetical protein